MKKVVLITGSTRGIGLATAKIFAESNYSVILNSKQQNAHATKALTAIKKITSDAIYVPFDVSSWKQTQTAAKKIHKKYSQVDVIVHNAGITRDVKINDLHVSDWNQVIKTNLSSAFHIIKPYLPNMINQKKGRIIFISSVIGKTGNYGQANYAASKSGLHGFTKSLAKELGPKGITVNAICPGYTDTDMLDKVPEKIMDKIIKRIPVGRLARPEEIGSLVKFLASDESSYINGSLIDINGGLF